MTVRRTMAGAVLAVAIGLACTACGTPGGGTTPSTGPGGLVVAHQVDVKPAYPPDNAQTAALTAFGEALFNQTLSTANPVISPLSVFSALAMAYDGAKADTATAFQTVLGMSDVEARNAAAYLLASLRSPGPGTTLTVANSAWLDDTLKVQQDWVDRLAAYFGAEVYNTDLQAPATLGGINSWISGKTNALIPHMVDSIDPSAVAMLINALYLKAAWAEPFNTDNTHTGVFIKPDGTQVDAWYMNSGMETRKYIQTDDAQGIVIPYQDGRLGFMAVMPTSGDLTLAPGTLSRWLAAAADHDNVILSIPKFHAEFGTTDLGDALKTLGLGVAFSPGTADFTGMGTSDAGPLYIGQVLHKVVMDVGEKGTEAAAATVVEMLAGGAPPTDQVWLSFDHPYIYAVMDLTTGVPLFLGAVTDPSLIPPTAK